LRWGTERERETRGENEGTWGKRERRREKGIKGNRDFGRGNGYGTEDGRERGEENGKGSV
jgi:hypothetical protein